MWKYGLLMKIKDGLLCAKKSRRIKVTSKLVLPSVSRFSFYPHYKSRAKLICSYCESVEVSHNTIWHLLTVLKFISIMLL